MEADFNFNNKVIARDIMNCVEQNHLFPMEQYSSHKGHQIIHQATNKRLVYGIAHY